MITIGAVRMKRYFLAVWTLGLVVCSLAPAFAEPVKITFLHTNDIYLIDQQNGKGGFPKLMTLLTQERAANPHTLTTFGGDLLSPSIMSAITQGSQMIELRMRSGCNTPCRAIMNSTLAPRCLPSASKRPKQCGWPPTCAVPMAKPLRV